MSKQKKTRIIIAILIVIFGTVANMYFSSILHQILSGGEISLPSLQIFINSIRVSKNHLKLFFSLELIIFLFGILYLVTNDKTYQSELIQITPNIMTPAPAGQNQFGSARWMTNEEKPKLFSICEINSNDRVINYLIKHGHDDLEEGVKEDT